jgi:hypothetical protein
VAFEPLCLDLWYMVSAQSKSSYTQEQQLSGIAMRSLREHATVRVAAPTPPPAPVTPSEVSVVLESPTSDELPRLWQALGLPLRTTAQYRFLTALGRRRSVVTCTPGSSGPSRRRPEMASWALAGAVALTPPRVGRPSITTSPASSWASVPR